jgi:hypothetical protein
LQRFDIDDPPLAVSHDDEKKAINNLRFARGQSFSGE